MTHITRFPCCPENVAPVSFKISPTTDTGMHNGGSLIRSLVFRNKEGKRRRLEASSLLLSISSMFAFVVGLPHGQFADHFQYGAARRHGVIGAPAPSHQLASNHRQPVHVIPPTAPGCDPGYDLKSPSTGVAVDGAIRDLLHAFSHLTLTNPLGLLYLSFIPSLTGFS